MCADIFDKLVTAHYLVEFILSQKKSSWFPSFLVSYWWFLYKNHLRDPCWNFITCLCKFFKTNYFPPVLLCLVSKFLEHNYLCYSVIPAVPVLCRVVMGVGVALAYFNCIPHFVLPYPCQTLHSYHVHILSTLVWVTYYCFSFEKMCTKLIWSSFGDAQCCCT